MVRIKALDRQRSPLDRLAEGATEEVLGLLARVCKGLGMVATAASQAIKHRQ